MSKKISIIVVALLGVCSVFAGTAEDLQSRLNAAIADNKPVEAVQWATALNQLRQAESASENAKMAKSANRVWAVYGNVLESAPAMLRGLQLWNSLQKERDEELDQMIQIGFTLLKLVDRPLSDGDVQPIVRSIDAHDKRMQAEWEARRKAMLPRNRK